MGIGTSIFLIAVGAVLAFAVEAEVEGVDIQVVGWILLIVGLIGLALSAMFWESWGGIRRRRSTIVDSGATRATYVDPVATRTTTVYEDDRPV